MERAASVMEVDVVATVKLNGRLTASNVFPITSGLKYTRNSTYTHTVHVNKQHMLVLQCLQSHSQELGSLRSNGQPLKLWLSQEEMAKSVIDSYELQNNNISIGDVILACKHLPNY